MPALKARTGEQRDAAALVGDRFEIVREIGRGGMGTVYLARDRVRDLPIALKTVSRADAGRIAHLKREFRTVAGLRHPNLVELHELFAEAGGCFFTMELIEGVDPRAWARGPSGRDRGDDLLTHAALYDATLSQVAEATESDPRTPEVTPSLGSSGKVRPGRPPPSAVPIDEARLRSLLAQLADGLAFLHGRGVVHRDVKASNALVRRDGRVKLLDFGLAFDWRTAVQAGKLTKAPTSGPLVGTVTYMAPEYLHGHRVSPAMDLYALGVLAFELVCGAPPFDGSFYEIVAAHVEQRAPRAIAFNPAVPEDLDELIAMLLTKDAAVRPSADEVAEIARAEAPVARRVARPRSRFVGRDAELARLLDTVAEVRDGVPRLAVIAGPSGAGKTALCDELLGRVPLRGVVLWRGRCYERERVPYRAFDQIVDNLAAELDDAGEVIDDLPHAAALARVFPSLAAVVAPSIREVGGAVSDLRVERDRAFAALATLLRRRLGDRTGLCVIDDLQWADDGSLELIEVLLAQRGWPLLVVATCTSDDAGALLAAPRALVDRHSGTAGAQAITVALGPLPDGRVAELIRSVAPLASSEVVAEVVRAAGGSPYLAELVAAEVLAEGVDGVAAVAGAELRRVARMSPSEQVVAEAAAVAGGTVSFARLRDITELDGPMLQSALRALELERVLRTAPGGVGDLAYDFYHHRLRREVYAGIAAPSRRQLHRRFADWYLSHAGDRPERAALAMHWEHAGEPSRAAPWALAAADAAMEQLAFDHAASWYQRAADLGLAPADDRRARERVAEALLWSGDFRRAASACRVLADQRDGAERERWLVRAAEAEIKLGELGAGLALIDRILMPRGQRWGGRRIGGVLRTAAVAARLAIRSAAPGRRIAGDEALAGAYRVVASFLSTPRPVESFEYVLRSVELARRRGDLAGQGMGLAMIAGYLAAGTLGWLGDDMLARSSALSQASADPYARMVSEAATGMLATSRGRWDDMRAAHDRGERICRDLGLERSWEASFLRSYWTLGELYAGEIDRAVGLAESLLERAGDLFSRAMIGSFRGRALAAAGRTTEAAAALDALVRDPAAEQGMPRMYRYALEGELALATGRWRDAVAIADEMGGVARAEWLWLMPAVAVMRDVIAATGELGVARAGGGGAAAAARRTRALARRLGRRSRSSFYAPTALRLEAQAEALLGHDRQARALLHEAARAAQLRGGRVERAAVEALLGGTAPDDDLRAAVAWATAGQVS